MTLPAQKHIAIIGGGPAGLMAAEMLSAYDCNVSVFDAMPSFGRKFLMAGKSGLNLTHAEEYEIFLTRYGQAQSYLQDSLNQFTPTMLRDWASELGIETFVGSSKRIFPTHYKASPLLRAWLNRLDKAGVMFHRRHLWSGWDKDGSLQFDTEDGQITIAADATVLAMGGASWPKLGSTGQWHSILSEQGIEISPFKPANCGFRVNWSQHLTEKFAGAPVKSVELITGSRALRGEFVISKRGVEGSAIYTISAELRDGLTNSEKDILFLDLLPDRGLEEIRKKLAQRRGSDSLSNHLRKTLGLKGVKTALLRELLDKETFSDTDRLSESIKELPIPVKQPHPIEEAISTAGGVPFEELDPSFMLKRMPGIFCAGEMLDWEAPTGGYLLNACFATGRVAGLGAAQWLELEEATP